MFGYLLRITVLAALYFAAAKLGLSLAFATDQVTTVWPPTGISLAVLILFGYKFWPGIFIGAFLANLSTNEPFPVAAAIAVGNTLEAIVGTYLLKKLVRFHPTMERVTDTLGLIVLGGLVSTLVSSVIGTITLNLGGLIEPEAAISVWLTWWLGDIMGCIVFAPLVLAWLNEKNRASIRLRPWEFFFLCVLVLIISRIVFIRLQDFQLTELPLQYLVFPPLIWAAVRFTQIGVSTANLIIISIAVWGTFLGLGPFTSGSQVEQNLIYLQLFMFSVATTSLLLSSAISEKNKNESLVELHEKMFESMIEKSSDAIYLVDEKIRIKYASSSVKRITGYRPDEVIGQDGLTFILPEDIKLVRKTFAALLLKPGGSLTIQMRIHRKDNIFIWTECTGTDLLFDPSVSAIVVNLHDITKEKESEKLKDEFLAAASHELRTPLVAIKNLISMINSGDYGIVTKSLTRPMTNIGLSAERLIRLVNDLLDVSRIENNRLKIELQEVTVDSIISDVQNLEAMAQQKGLTYETQGLSSPLLRVDPDRAREILSNLVDNAIKYTAKGGVSITTKDAGKFMEIRVIDTGSGIPKADQSKLFGRFIQVGNQSGTGLGLYISRQLARKMGGDIILEKSEEEKGSTFALFLPVADKQ